MVRQFVREGRLGAAVLSLAEGDQDGASVRQEVQVREQLRDGSRPTLMPRNRPMARLAGKPHTGAFSNQWCGFGE